MKPPHGMVATYRLQLTPVFGFAAARAVVPYLADLGASHLYLSPIFEARPGSTHGYDQTDPTTVRAELGGEPAFHDLASAASDAGMGILLDIVPNHAAAHHANPWWFGLLKHGPGSTFDRFFDVAWDASRGRVVLPVLGSTPAQCAADGQLTFTRDEALGPCAAYFDRLFPLRDDRPLPADDSPAALLEALSCQHYELAQWREGLERINYRRFFDIADLAGLRVEHDEVFDITHAKILDLVGRGLVHALRVDHIDGLRDPLAYLARLREALDRAAGPRVPIFVEKILAHDESLPGEWPVAGTTGYEFLAALGQLWSSPRGVEAIRRHVAQSTPEPFGALAIACKREAAETILRPELNRLCDALRAALHAAGRAIPDESLRDGVIALSAGLGVYRAYADRRGMTPEDRARVRRAASAAGLAGAASSLLDLLTLSGPFEAAPLRARALECVQRWQQFTGPLAAKGVEDTALYRDTASPWLCDVGAEPEIRDSDREWSVVAGHRSVRPLSMNTTDTHDAKRSEDARAALAALSHAPEEWTGIIDEAVALASRTRISRADLVLILSSVYALLGREPGESPAPRVREYAVKAVREAKRESSWLAPNEDYERRCRETVDLFVSPEGAGVRARMTALRGRVEVRASRTSVAQGLLKCLFPGIPDIYQGTDLRVFALADPDNRRPVDFERRVRLLDLAKQAWAARDPERVRDADSRKLLAVWRALAVRRGLLLRGPLRLESLRSTAPALEWKIAAADALCAVRVEFEDGPAPHPHEPGLDQLGAMLRDGPRPWATVVVQGVSALF